MNPKLRLVISAESDELMVHWLNGRVEFVGLLEALKLCWWLARRGTPFVVVDAATGREFDFQPNF